MANNQELGSMIISVSMDDNNFTNTLDGIKRSMKTAQSEMKAQINTLESVGDKYGAVEAKIKGLNTQLELSEKEVQELTKRHQQAVQTYGEHSAEAQKLATKINNTVSRMATYRRAIQNAEQSLERLGQQTEETVSKMDKFHHTLDKFDGVASKVRIASGVMATAIAGVGVSAIKIASDFEDANIKIENSVAGTTEEVEAMQGKMKNIYQDGLGESSEDVANAIIEVKNNIHGLNDADLEDVTKQAMVLGQTFDADVTEVTRGASAMVTEFGVSAEEAMDLFAVGGKNGLNFSKEMFDNVAEYSRFFKQMGYDAEEMFEVLANGKNAGAYNFDKINDAVKEFSLRIGEDSKATRGAMQELSPATLQLWEDFLAGKATMKEVHDSAITDLENMDDQVAANSIGTTLWGTQWEDNGAKVIYSLNDQSDAFDNTSGSAKKMTENVEESFGVRLQSTLRKFQSTLLPIGEQLLEISEEVLPKLESVIPKIESAIESTADKVKELNEWWGGLNDNTQDFIKGSGAVIATLTTVGLLLSPIVKAVTAISKGGKGLMTGLGALGGLVGLGFGKKRNRGNTGGLGSNDNTGGTGGTGRRSDRNSDNEDTSSTRSERNASPTSKWGKIGKVAKGVGKRVPVVGTLASLGLGAYSMAKADTKEDKIDTAAGMAGMGVGTALGGALGSFAGPLGTLAGSALGGYLGEKAGKAISLKFTADDRELKAKLTEYDKKIEEAKKKYDSGIDLKYTGKSIAEGTKKSLNDFEQLRVKTQSTVNDVYLSGQNVTGKIIQNVTASQTEYANSVTKSINSREKAEIASINKMDNLKDKEKQDAIAKVKEKYAKERESVTSGEARIKEILTNAKNKKRSLTQAEANEIKMINDNANRKKISATAKNKAEEKSIIKKFSSEKASIEIKSANKSITEANKEYKKTVESAKEKYKQRITQAKHLYEDEGAISKAQYDKLVSEAKKEKEETINQSKKKKAGVIKKATEQKKEAQKIAKEQRDKVVSEAEKQKEDTIKAYDELSDGTSKAWNWLLGFLGFDKKSTSKKASTKVSSGGQSMVAYAKGTAIGSHKGGMALVGEEGPELAHVPSSGFTMLGTGGQEVVNLPKGTAVLPHGKTKKVMQGEGSNALFNKYNFPMYAKGTGDDNVLLSAWETVKGLTSDAWGGIKSVAKSAVNMAKGGVDAVWGKVKEKIPMSDNLLVSASQMTSRLKDITMKPISELLNKFFNFKSEEESMAGAGGSFGSYAPFSGSFSKISNSWGVYDFLHNLAKQVMNKYPKLSITSGQRNTMTKAGTVSDHANHRGIDLSGYGSKSMKYYEIAKTLSNHPYLQYVIGSNKWNTSGGGSSFVDFPYGGHMNHIHLSAKTPDGAKASGSVAGTGGGNVEQWRNVAKKALEMTGNYSEGNLNALLRRMNQESGGNAKAINNWDSNAKKGTPSKGLMQVIDPTFKANAMKGHNSDVYDPLSNILASIRYTLKRYGSLQNGWGRVGGYSFGGMITKEQLAMVGEGDKPEMVIPLDKAKKGRAMQLLKKAGSMLGVSVNEPTTGGNASTSGNESGIIQALTQQNNILMNILNAVMNVDLNVAIGDEQIYNANNRKSQQVNRVTNYARGV